MSIWSEILFSYGSAGVSVTSSRGYNYLFNKYRKEPGIEWRNNAKVKNIYVQMAKQVTVQTMEATLNQLLPRLKRSMAQRHRDYVSKQQEKNWATIINNQDRQTSDYGKITLLEGETVIARAQDGSVVPESLFMWYDGPDDEVEQWQIPSLHDLWKQSGESSTVFFLDLMPSFAMSSQKNVVLTQVQGRDYTRKELVSGGDLSFTINGVISTDMPGVYPVAMVQKFLKVCQYNGIVNVKSQFLGQLNIEHVIIKDFSLDKQEFKNIQPYSISCVAIEEADDITVTDTIKGINNIIADPSSNSWFEKILSSRIADSVSSVVATNATGLGTLAIDKLVPNI